MLYERILRRRQNTELLTTDDIKAAPEEDAGAAVSERPTGSAVQPIDRTMVLYIAGPMRGYDDYNFPAFFKAEAALEMLGHMPVNPARRDQAAGFDEKSPVVSQQFIRTALAWDLGQVCRSDGVVILAGWHSSRGARAEVATARAIGIPIYILVHRAGDVELREAHHAGT